MTTYVLHVVLFIILCFTGVDNTTAVVGRKGFRQHHNNINKNATHSPPHVFGENEFDHTIDYERWQLNKTILDTVYCPPPPACPATDSFNPKRLFNHLVRMRGSLIDSNRKILMEFTPKAACTLAVSMFLKSVGFHMNVHYNIWPHNFRERYFYPRCGEANACVYLDPTWYRFKVVRNPYDRAVSSYIHLCRFPEIGAGVFDSGLIPTLSFERFLEILLSLPVATIEDLASGHLGYQSTAYERQIFYDNLRGAKPKRILFHRIVKAETLQEDLDKYVNAETNSTFQPFYRGEHLVHRSNEQKEYVGDVEWNLLKAKIPKDYGTFYNEYSKDLVSQIFYWDLKLYNYTFPFDRT